jgi:hypothetical protein
VGYDFWAGVENIFAHFSALLMKTRDVRLAGDEKPRRAE